MIAVYFPEEGTLHIDVVGNSNIKPIFNYCLNVKVKTMELQATPGVK